MKNAVLSAGRCEHSLLFFPPLCCIVGNQSLAQHETKTGMSVTELQIFAQKIYFSGKETLDDVEIQTLSCLLCAVVDVLRLRHGVLGAKTVLRP